MDPKLLIALQNRFRAAFELEVAASPWKRFEMVGSATTRADVDLEVAMAAAAQQVLGSDVVVVGEEAVSAGAWADIRAKRAILIDPIDGTRLFRAGAPGFASTFTVLQGGMVMGGGITLPTTDQELLFGPPPHRPLIRRLTTKGDVSELAVRVADTVSTGLLAQHFAQYGFTIAKLGSSARRLLEIADGGCGGLIKRVDVTVGVPRLWGIAAGLAYCASRGARFWWDPASWTLAVGGPRLEAAWPAQSTLKPIEYGALWSELLALGAK